jgi:hypothetical protein
MRLLKSFNYASTLTETLAAFPVAFPPPTVIRKHQVGSRTIRLTDLMFRDPGI